MNAWCMIAIDSDMLEEDAIRPARRVFLGYRWHGSSFYSPSQAEASKRPTFYLLLHSTLRVPAFECTTLAMERNHRSTLPLPPEISLANKLQVLHAGFRPAHVYLYNMHPGSSMTPRRTQFTSYSAPASTAGLAHSRGCSRRNVAVLEDQHPRRHRARSRLLHAPGVRRRPPRVQL